MLDGVSPLEHLRRIKDRKLLDVQLVEHLCLEALQAAYLLGIGSRPFGSAQGRLPEAAPAPAHVPVRKVLYKPLDRAAARCRIVLLQAVRNLTHESVQLGEHPPVELRLLTGIRRLRIETIQVRVRHEK